MQDEQPTRLYAIVVPPKGGEDKSGYMIGIYDRTSTGAWKLNDYVKDENGKYARCPRDDLGYQEKIDYIVEYYDLPRELIVFGRPTIDNDKRGR